jgi:hypothetical protein
MNKKEKRPKWAAFYFKDEFIDYIRKTADKKCYICKNAI